MIKTGRIVKAMESVNKHLGDDSWLEVFPQQVRDVAAMNTIPFGARTYSEQHPEDGGQSPLLVKLEYWIEHSYRLQTCIPEKLFMHIPRWMTSGEQGEQTEERFKGFQARQQTEMDVVLGTSPFADTLAGKVVCMFCGVIVLKGEEETLEHQEDCAYLLLARKRAKAKAKQEQLA